MLIPNLYHNYPHPPYLGLLPLLRGQVDPLDPPHEEEAGEGEAGQGEGEGEEEGLHL